MNAKNTTVKLKAWDGTSEFPIGHAEHILNMDVRGGSGWELADSRFELVDGTLRRKAENKVKEA